MNKQEVVSQSDVSLNSFDPRSSSPMEVDADVSLEEINTASCRSPSPEPNQLVQIRQSRQRGYPALSTCRMHGEQIRFYCNDCRKKCCFACILTCHSNCQAELFKKIALKLSENALEDDIKHFNKLRDYLANLKNTFDSHVVNLKRNIDIMADNVIAQVERKRDELKNSLMLVVSERHKFWTSQLEMCQLSLGTVESYLKKTGGCDLTDVNFLRRDVLTKMRTSLEFIDGGEIDIDFSDSPEYKFGRVKTPPCPRKSFVATPANSIANMYNSCTVFIRNILEEQVDGNYFITATIQDSDLNCAYLTIRNEKRGKFEISFYPTKPGKYLLHVFLNAFPIGECPYELNVVQMESEHTPRSRLIFGDSGDEKLSKPWGICSDYNGRIIVVDRGNDCVKMFTEEGQFIKKFGQTGSGPGEFFRPTGIAVDHILKRLVVVDKDNHRIQVFNFSGIYLLEFGSKGENNGQFIYPWDVAVSESSLIAVSDSNNRRIQIFDQRGGFIRMFSFNVKAIPEIELPRGLAFKSDGSLMVTDFNKHRVIVFDDGFESARAVGSEGNRLGQFMRPQCIDVDAAGKYAVSDCKNDRVQVFKPNGELFCAFGSSGSEPGQMSSPQGICFLPNDRVAIVELNNNRVQIFEIPKGA